MKNLVLFMTFGFGLPFLGCQSTPGNTTEATPEPRLTRLWECKEGLSVPESALFDLPRDVIYVSSINGEPAEKDGNGYISKLSPDGELLDSAWITGLNAPKGMGISGGNLYVSDIDRLVEIDIATGTISRTFEAPGAKFLNDVAIGPGAAVFVSDMRGASIYILQGDSFTLWLADDDMLKGVNGLHTMGDILYAGASGRILMFREPGGEAAVAADSTGSIDGLEHYHGAWVYSDWLGKISFRQDQEEITLLDTTRDKVNAADIDVVESRNLLLVPTFFHNSIAAYRIEMVTTDR